MAVSKDLFLSILAMDAYNQGYEPGINHGKIKIGTSTVDQDSLVLNNDPNDPARVDEAAGFYALSYDIGADGPEGLAGKTVISYRGTDNIPWSELVTIDLPIILGTGFPEQLTLASTFRNAVDALSSRDIILTGHSLGGGLAA